MVRRRCRRASLEISLRAVKMDVRIVKSVIILLVVSLSLFLQNKQKKGTEIQKVFNRSLKELKNSRMEEEGGEGLRQKEGI